MNVASENQPAMFLGIFFRLRFAGSLNFELALGEIRNCHINVGMWNCIEQYV